MKKLILNSELPIVTKYDEKYQKEEKIVLDNKIANGDINALFELARRYQYGYGDIEKNVVKAVGLYKEILKYQRNVGAMYQLGYLYAYCEKQLGEENRIKSVDYFEAAMELGNPDAAVQLGILYESGDLVNCD